MERNQSRSSTTSTIGLGLVLLSCNTILGNEPAHRVSGHGGTPSTDVPIGGGMGSGGQVASLDGGGRASSNANSQPNASNGSGGEGPGSLQITGSAGVAGLVLTGGEATVQSTAATTAGAAGTVTSAGGVSSVGSATGGGSSVCRCAAANSVCHGGQCVTPLDVAAGGFHTCVLLVGGAVECWGSNAWGELGIGTTSSYVRTPTRVSGLANVLVVAAGARFTCALVANGTVQCWGDNRVGQLGNGTTTSSNTPVSVLGLIDVKHIAAGYDFACAVVSDGTVRCWGNNSAGQLGNGTTAASSTPVMVQNLLRATSVAAGFDSACAIVDGAVKCWGSNYFGQLGDSTGRSSSTPVDVANLTSVTSIAALCDEAPIRLAPAEHASGGVCARVSDSTVRCWGSNDLGELGNGQASAESFVPVVVTNLEHVESLTAGNRFVCATTADGNVKCWGSNVAGQLGSEASSTSFSSTPSTVSQLAKVTKLAAGTWHVCAQLSNGTIVCWGSNDQGQLGNGTRTSSSVPVAVVW